MLFRTTLPLLCLLFTNLSASSQKIETIAGSGCKGNSGIGGSAISACLDRPTGMAQDNDGNIYIADNANHTVKKVSKNGVLSIFAGTGQSGYSGDNGKAVFARLNEPNDVEVDAEGNVLIIDQGNNVVRKVNRGGIITTIIGNGSRGSSGDGGPAVNATLLIPTSLTIDTEGNIYLADAGNERIRKIGTDGIIRNYAGNGIKGYSGDGKDAVNASIAYVNGIIADKHGNIYFAQKDNHVIRKINNKGKIYTFAGSGKMGYTGDGGLAINATFNGPYGLAIDDDGNLFVADNGNGCIRKIDKKGIVSTIAGNGANGAGNGTNPMKTSFNNPTFLRISKDKGVLIADRGHNRVRKILLCPEMRYNEIKGTTIEEGKMVQLPEPIKGGHWSSGDPHITLSLTGMVKGITKGPAIITFTSPDIPYCDLIVSVLQIEVLPHTSDNRNK